MKSEGTVAEVLAGAARFAVVCGDAVEVMRTLPDGCAHVTYCDPPYGLSAQSTADVVECLRAWLDGRVYTHGRGGMMGHEWDSFVPGPEAWREVHRALRPGGYCVAYSSTRTVDLLGIAVRLAGFEVRPGWAWAFGAGFPKSLDVSKAIDRADGAEREVIGKHPSPAGNGALASASIGGGWSEGDVYITAPATEAAAQWDGYGTDVKPAFEPLVVARKRMESPAIDIVGAIEDQMRHNGVQGHIRWKSERAASARKSSAEASSISTSLHVSAADSSAKNAGEQETLLRANETGSLFASSTEGTTPRTESRYSTRTARGREKTEKNCCLRTADDAPAAGNPDGSFSRSTTSTETAGNTAGGATATPTETSSGAVTHKTDTAFCAGTATAPSASTDTALTVTFEGVRYEIARDGDCFVWPSGLAKFRAAESLTVAANVQRHGCGALNIDAGRIGTTPRSTHAEGNIRGGDMFGGGFAVGTVEAPASGRFPAALALVHDEECERVGTRKILPDGQRRFATQFPRRTETQGYNFAGGIEGVRSHKTTAGGLIGEDGLETVDDWHCTPTCAVRELARQSGTSRDGVAVQRNGGGQSIFGGIGDGSAGLARPDAGYGGEGTAARFFWQAKAAASDRLAFVTCAPGCTAHETVIGAREARASATCPTCGSARTKHEHATVKPLDLARYHARLLSLPAHVAPLALVPYCGSGPEARALLEVGFRVIAVDLDARHCAMTRHRLAQPLDATAPQTRTEAPAAPVVVAPVATSPIAAPRPARRQPAATAQLDLFSPPPKDRA